MKLSQILMLNCYEKENYEILKASLKKLPFFKKVKNVDTITVKDLENAFHKISDKYDIMLSYIMHNRLDDKTYCYSFMLKNKNTHEWLKTIHSIDLFEGFAKVLLFAYAYTRKIKKGGRQ